jgi:peptide/nickel transport system substrate-binding protein
VFSDYRPGETFVAKKNPNYWGKDADGTPYPYLDEVEFRIYQDALTRKSALEAGDVDIIHTTNGETIAEFRDSKAFPMEETDQLGETGNSPFSPGQLGHMDDTGFPLKQDMEKAKQLTAKWKAENPGKELKIELATTNDQTNLVIAQDQHQWFKEAGYDDVTINQIEQAKYILTALQGAFQAFQWRNHGGIDLDAQYIWWHSSNALPVGELALTFGRIKDPVIDGALDANRGETDPAKKKEYAETVAKQFGKECYNLWGSYTVWGIPHEDNVNVGILQLPGGEQAAMGAGIAGTFSVAASWIQQ